MLVVFLYMSAARGSRGCYFEKILNKLLANGSIHPSCLLNEDNEMANKLNYYFALPFSAVEEDEVCQRNQN